MPTILLLDNGSKRAGATLSLRALAAALTERIGAEVAPVSLLHSDAIPPERLAGRPAETLEPFLKRRLSAGARDFLILPLFFGPSRALSQFIPETASALAGALGPFSLRLAPELCPLPPGEPRLTEILADNLGAAARALGLGIRRVVLVDHGSPIPAVTEARRWLAGRLAPRLGAGVELREAVMERRAGPEYDFNGPLLEEQLHRMAAEDPATPVLLSMLFLAAGRHAGPGGDISDICARIERAHPGLRIHPSPLVGTHPLLIDILADRATDAARQRALSPGADRGCETSDST